MGLVLLLVCGAAGLADLCDRGKTQPLKDGEFVHGVSYNVFIYTSMMSWCSRCKNNFSISLKSGST